MALVMVAGCQRTRHKVILVPNPSVPYKVDGAHDALQTDLQTELKKRGVKVISVGQDYLISIPTRMLFADQSPRLLWHSYDVLYTVICFLRQYRKIDVQVIAYSGKCVSQEREMALTRARAREVGNYLWSQGVKSRFVFTQGLGSGKPVVAEPGSGDMSENARIEITFRDAIR